MADNLTKMFNEKMAMLEKKSEENKKRIAKLEEELVACKIHKKTAKDLFDEFSAQFVLTNVTLEEQLKKIQLINQKS